MYEYIHFNRFIFIEEFPQSLKFINYEKVKKRIEQFAHPYRYQSYNTDWF